MRATRAMFGAFGAGVSLAIAASVALLVVSSVVAFRGWPENASAPGDPEVAQLEANRAEAKRSAATEIVSLPKAIARTPVTAHRGGSAHVDATHIQASAGTQPAQAATTTTASGTTAGKHPTGSATKTSTTKPATDIVRKTTQAAADAVAPVVPSAANALQSVGAAGADAVDKVGEAAQSAVGKALGH